MYESTWTDLCGSDAKELLEYEGRTLASTWNVSFDHVSRTDADTVELFKFWAYFSNDDIWFELIQAGAAGGPAWMHRVTTNRIRFGRAMTKLQDYSLVEAAASSYSIHRCIHDWVSERFEADEATFLGALRCNANSVTHNESIEYWTIKRRLFPHIDRLNSERFRLFWD